VPKNVRTSEQIDDEKKYSGNGKCRTTGRIDKGNHDNSFQCGFTVYN
jgi:hypothetical protein